MSQLDDALDIDIEDNVKSAVKQEIKDLLIELIQDCKWYSDKDGVVAHVFIEGKELSQKVDAL